MIPVDDRQPLTELLTKEDLERAAAIHRRIARLYAELATMFEAPPTRQTEATARPTNVEITHIDRARAKKLLGVRGYRVR